MKNSMENKKNYDKENIDQNNQTTNLKENSNLGEKNNRITDFMVDRYERYNRIVLNKIKDNREKHRNPNVRYNEERKLLINRAAEAFIDTNKSKLYSKPKLSIYERINNNIRRIYKNKHYRPSDNNQFCFNIQSINKKFDSYSIDKNSIGYPFVSNYTTMIPYENVLEKSNKLSNLETVSYKRSIENKADNISQIDKTKLMSDKNYATISSENKDKSEITVIATEKDDILPIESFDIEMNSKNDIFEQSDQEKHNYKLQIQTYNNQPMIYNSKKEHNSSESEDYENQINKYDIKKKKFNQDDDVYNDARKDKVPRKKMYSNKEESTDDQNVIDAAKGLLMLYRSLKMNKY